VEKTFACSVITPERVVLECEASFAALPAHDGELGILRNRAPLLLKLGIGRLRVQTTDGSHVVFVDGGFAQMAHNRLTILTQQALRPEEIDRQAAEQALAEARAMKIPDDDAFAARQMALRRAQVQLQIAQ
jgi:F-type H+-transporting ATPase subunit epsilon